MQQEILTKLQSDTLNVIKGHNKQNPITGKKIANMIGLKPRDTGKEGADMRSIIHALRIKGVPICASGNGYYLPQSKKELEKYILGLEGRIKKISETLSVLKNGSEKFGTIEFRKEPKFIYFENNNNLVSKIAEDKVEEYLKLNPNARKIN